MTFISYPTFSIYSGFCGDLLTFIFIFTGILLHMAGAAPTPGTLKSFLRRCLALLQCLGEADGRI
jgi:hypothetical protein